jgi:hypothetical protein
MPTRLLPSRQWLILVLVAAIGCAGRRDASDHDAGHWIAISETPAMRITLDSSRIQADSLGAFVWLRFDYAVTNPPMSDMPQPWRQMESRHLVDCEARRAKDIAMVIIDTAGVRHDGSQGLSPAWQTFEAHPLTVNVLGPVCAALPVRRGA